ncbi:MAG: hypothetical protein KAW49_10020 [Anaerolineae bacterium]|jgi:hypothetical protein|nr:hypothetical protein [Anaerolineae bacterium]
MRQEVSDVSKESPKGDLLSPKTDRDAPVIAALDRFNTISNPWLRSTVISLPVVLGLLLLADWLIGQGAFAGDMLRLTAVLVAAVELFAIRVLFDKVPEALRTIWTRSLVGSSSDSQSAPEFSQFLRQFEGALNHRLAWLVGLIFAIASLAATYPVRYFLTAGGSPFSPAELVSYYFFGNVAIIAALLGYVIGLLTWRVGVIAFFITSLGKRFELKIIPKHPDQSGGLRPLGDLCLTIALLLLLPACFLSYWGFVTTFFDAEGMEIYAMLWSGLYRKWLVILSVAALFFFLQPLYRIHLQMKKQRQEIQLELDELSQRMGEISLELRTQAHTITPEQGAKKLASLEFMGKVYQENSRVPTWPFDWNIITKFVVAQAVPILSLVGTSAPLISVIQSLLSSLSQ